MTAKWTGLMLKTKNQSNVSLTSYCKNLHLFILFCIDWMLENLKICPYSQAQKGFKKKEKKKTTKNSKWISACTGLYFPPPALSYPIRSQPFQPSSLSAAGWFGLCFLAPSAWFPGDYMGEPMAFLLWLPVSFFSVLYACSFRWVKSPMAEGCRRRLAWDPQRAGRG